MTLGRRVRVDDSELIEKFRAVFSREPEVVARAPGRIEVIGNHTDYNGGVVLGAAIDRDVRVALARRVDGRRNFYSDQHASVASISSADLKKRSGESSWINYPLGVLASLPEFGLRAPDGFDYFVTSNLPAGAGLSSSAAIELASLHAFLEASDQHPPRETLVKIGRHAENNFVGVPCGILDQAVSGLGRKDHLVFIDCRGPQFDFVPLPANARFWIFNTHAKHALVDGLYAARHRECMEAATKLGVSQLAEVNEAMLVAAGQKLPETIFKRARHVVEEIARTHAAVRAFSGGDLAAAGKLLTASHRSSQWLFENSTPELDFLVDVLTTVPRVHGARLTGGGFGGAVLALTQEDFGTSEAEQVASAYAEKFGSRPDVLRCRTANGAEVIRV